MCEDGEWLKVAQQQGLKHLCQGSGFTTVELFKVIP